MKKLAMFLVVGLMLAGSMVFAKDDMGSMPMKDKSMPMADNKMQEKMKVYQCPMDGYTAEKAGKCPKCGMALEEKEMSADEAKAAVEKSKGSN